MITKLTGKLRLALAGIGYEHPLDDGWTLRVELQ